MVSITAKIDMRSLDQIAFLRNEERRQIALANVLNNTAKAIQKAEVEHLRATFHVRPERKTFVERQVAIISPFASAKKGVMHARIRVGDKPRLLLAKFEAGGVHEPVKGANVAVPVTGVARPSIAMNIRPEFLFPALALQKRKGTWQGQQKTFVISGKGVFQRVGGSTRKVYAFKPTTKVPPTLQFAKTALAVVAVVVPVFLKAEVDKAMNYALRGSGQFFQKMFANESGD